MAESSEEKPVVVETDFEDNLRDAKIWIENIQPLLEQGMSVCMGGSHAHNDRLLWINYYPPQSCPDGVYGNPVDLFRTNYQFKRDVVANFNAVKQTAIRINARYRD